MADCSVKEMIDGEGSWDVDKINEILIPQAMNIIRPTIPPRASCGRYLLIWGKENDCLSSMKSTYNIITKESRRKGPTIWELIWKWKGLEMIKYFL